MVELAIVLPVLVAAVLLALDLGRVYFSYVGIRAAAERGAIAASDLSKDHTAINDAVKSEPGLTMAIKDADIAVSCPEGSTSGTPGAACRRHGYPVKVEVRAIFTPLIPYADLLWRSDIVIKASASAVVM